MPSSRDQKPNSPPLFGASRVRRRNSKVAVVPWPIDVSACWDARVPAVGLYGVQLSEGHRRVIGRLPIRTAVLLMTNSDEGQAAIHDLAADLTGLGIDVQVAVWRPYWLATYPHELTATRLRKAFHSARPYAQWATPVTP